MIFYFSGTGNSQFVAMQLAKILTDEVVSINQLIKDGKKAAFHSERPLVFVAPTYAWRLPRVVEQWIQAASFEGSRSRDAYFILTCGMDCGNAAAYAKKLCVKKQLQFRGLLPIRMPENYLAMFPTPDEAQCRAIVETARPQITALAERIRSGSPFSPEPISLGGRLASGPVNPLFYALFVKDKGFTVSDKCISCGQCARRCPLNNISLTDGRPRWNGNCTHCMACIGGCPIGAIEYKRNSQGRHRYYIMDDSSAAQ